MDKTNKFDSDEFLFYFNKIIESKCMDICIKEENSKELECLKKLIVVVKDQITM